MEEELKILEEMCNEIIKKDDCNLFETLSPLEIALKLENLLKRYKELEEQNKTLTDEYMIQKHLINADFLKDYIPISVIQNKIDEYREKRNKLADGHFWDNERNINEDTSLFIAIETLKLLLEERR